MRQLALILLSISPWLFACGEVLPPEDPCTGVCECRVDDDCGSHEVCDDQVTSRTCGCAFGYTADPSGACLWSGVVADPGFQSSTGWMSSAAGVVNVNLNAAGMIDPGAAQFQEASLCSFARVTQSLEMPRRSRAEPLVVQISYRTRDPMFMSFSGPAFGVGASWQESLPLAIQQFQTSRICLGAEQYAPEDSTGRGAARPLEIMPAGATGGFQCTTPEVGIDVDRFEIVPANPGECPDPGTALNGNAEEAGGWTLSVPGNQTTATIEPGVGEGATRGVRMFARNRCSYVSATTKVSIPSGTAAAVSFFNKTSAAVATNVETYVGLEGAALPDISATGAPLTHKFCVPAPKRGGVFNFNAGMSLDGTCADVINAESIVDNVRVIEEPGCGTDPAISDPGFEAGLTLLGASAEAGKSFVRALRDPAIAHSGSGALQLSVMQLCSGATWRANVIVPPPAPGQGPAVRFFYRARPLANARFSVFGSGTGPNFTPTLDDLWNEGIVCLRPGFAGRSQDVSFSLSTSGTCATTFPPEVAFIDDLEVTTSASCPAM